MAQNSCGLYRPYGASELKATYQRNLLCGTLAVTTLVAVIVITVAVYRKPEMVVINVGDAVASIDSFVVRLTQQSILYESPDLPLAERQAPVDLIGTIPVPVDDAFFDDREDVVIPSRVELAQAVGPGVRSEGDFVGGVLDTVTDHFPGITDFVPHEIKPLLIQKYQGEYPRLARRAGLTGKVVMAVLVDGEGKVVEAQVARPSGVGSLDEAARRWTFRCIFSPGIQNGRPIAMWVSFTYNFVLD